MDDKYKRDFQQPFSVAKEDEAFKERAVHALEYIAAQLYLIRAKLYESNDRGR